MIWVIANSKEEDGSFPTYRFYKEAFQDSEIDICCAKQDDDFSFLIKDDIAFIRTRDENINQCVNEAQAKIGFKSTLESPLTNSLTHDKEEIKPVLCKYGIPFPLTVNIEDIEIGSKYFVKPLYGENSMGIDSNSVCFTESQVLSKCASLHKMGFRPIIEQYIDGYDITTSIIYSPKYNALKTYSAFTNANNADGIQTDETKSTYNFQACLCESEKIDHIAKKVFEAVGAKHYLRIDFRVQNHIPYVIDINMIPGLAPNGYMARCMEVNGVGYHDFIRMVVGSAF